jgi:hypothetical protein
MSTYHCTKCNKYFVRNDLYQKHLHTKLHNKESSFYESGLTCKCGKTYSHVQSLNRHKHTCKYLNPPSVEECLEGSKTELVKMKAEILRQQNIIEALESKCKDLEKKLDKKSTSTQLEKRCERLEARLEERKTVITIRHQGRRKLSQKTREEVAARQENKCNQCQVTLTKYYQIDHKTALQYGGTDEFENLQALCCECHAEKSVLENQHRKEIQEAIHSILQGHVLEK